MFWSVPLLMRGVVIDITARRHSEIELQQVRIRATRENVEPSRDDLGCKVGHAQGQVR